MSFHRSICSLRMSSALWPRRYETQGNTRVVFGDPKLEAELLPRLLEPEVSPLFIDSFDKVPNTYVVIGEFDLLRDDSLLFVRRLRASGRVRVAHKQYPLYADGFMNMAVPGVVKGRFRCFRSKESSFLLMIIESPYFTLLVVRLTRILNAIKLIVYYRNKVADQVKWSL